MGFLSSGDGWGREQSWIPEQGLLGVWRLVCTWARQGLLGHLFVDVPGSHSDPQHGRKRGIVQRNAHLGGKNVTRQPPPPATSPACTADSLRAAQTLCGEYSEPWQLLCSSLGTIKRGRSIGEQVGNESEAAETLTLLSYLLCTWTWGRLVGLHTGSPSAGRLCHLYVWALVHTPMCEPWPHSGPPSGRQAQLHSRAPNMYSLRHRV